MADSKVNKVMWIVLAMAFYWGFVKESPKHPSMVGCEGLSSDFTKMLKTKDFSDVNLKCDDVSFAAHKVILSARSKVFESMFKHDVVENEENTFILRDIDCDIFYKFLYYLYSAKLPQLTVEEAYRLSRIATKYDVESLKIECTNYMEYTLTIENFFTYYILADSYQDVKFKNRLMLFAKKESHNILNHDYFQKFRENFPVSAKEVYKACTEK